MANCRRTPHSFRRSRSRRLQQAQSKEGQYLDLSGSEFRKHRLQTDGATGGREGRWANPSGLQACERSFSRLFGGGYYRRHGGDVIAVTIATIHRENYEDYGCGSVTHRRFPRSAREFQRASREFLCPGRWYCGQSGIWQGDVLPRTWPTEFDAKLRRKIAKSKSKRAEKKRRKLQRNWLR